MYYWFYLSTSPLVACCSQPVRPSSTSVVILNDVYRSSNSFVNNRDVLCSSLSELNRRASSGLLERHYGGDSLSQDPNDYRTIEIEMGIFSPSGPKAKSVACLRGLAEEEGDGGVAGPPPNSPNWVLLRPSSAELIKPSRKQKAQSMDEFAARRLKRVVHFENDSDLHPSYSTSSTNWDPEGMLNAACTDDRRALRPETTNSVTLVSSIDSGLTDPCFSSQVPLMRHRSLDDITDLGQQCEKPWGTPHSCSYTTLDVIPEDGTLQDNDTHLLDSSMESGELHVLNGANNEADVSMETMETIAMVTSSGIFEDEAPHGASSTVDRCSSLSQPGPLTAGEMGTATDDFVTQKPSSGEGLSSQNATQRTADEQCVVGHQEEEESADERQDIYQDMVAERGEDSDTSPVSQTSMEGTPPLKIKVSFTIIEEADRKVVKDPSPMRMGQVGGECVSRSRLPQCNEGMVASHGTTNHITSSPKVGESLPLDSSDLAGEHIDCHGNQTADSVGGPVSNSVHIIREIFLKQPQTEGSCDSNHQPILDRAHDRRKSREVLAKRWPQLLEEERRWADGDDDLLLCASVPTLDLADSETDLQYTSEPNLLTDHQVKVYSGSEGFTGGQSPPGSSGDVASSDGKQDLESVNWFSGVVTETLQFQMDKQDEAVPDFGRYSHFELGDHSNNDDSTSDSTDDSDDDGFVQPSVVSGLDLVSMTPPPWYPTLRSILNCNQMYLPSSGENPNHAGMSLEHRKVSTKPRMSIIREEEEAVVEELARRM